MNTIEPNPHVALNNARNLPKTGLGKLKTPMLGRRPVEAAVPAANSSGADAIEKYIDQRDALWRTLAIGQAELSAIAVNLLKDRNDFIEAMFRFKLAKQLFTPERIKREKQRAKVCEAFVDQLNDEIKSLMRSATTLASDL